MAKLLELNGSFLGSMSAKAGFDCSLFLACSMAEKHEQLSFVLTCKVGGKIAVTLKQSRQTAMCRHLALLAPL